MNRTFTFVSHFCWKSKLFCLLPFFVFGTAFVGIAQSFSWFGRLLMPSPSASSKFGSSILKFFGHAQFFMYTQNRFGILKS